MNPINELRLLAEDLHSAGGHSRYAAALSKAADELGSLERYRTAYNEWVAKTEWVQADTTLPAKYLGMHRADVLKGMISELFDRLEAAEKERDELRESEKWYRRRCDLLQEQQSKMRDPERAIVCDILANGGLLHQTVAGNRYALPVAQGEKDV